MQSQCSFHLVVKSCDGRSILLPCCVAPSLSWTPHRLLTLAYRPHCVLGTRNVSQQGGQYSRQLIVCAHGICRRGVSQFPRCRAWNICGTKGRKSNHWSCKWTCPRIWVDRRGVEGLRRVGMGAGYAAGTATRESPWRPQGKVLPSRRVSSNFLARACVYFTRPHLLSPKLESTRSLVAISSGCQAPINCNLGSLDAYFHWTRCWSTDEAAASLALPWTPHPPTHQISVFPACTSLSKEPRLCRASDRVLLISV